MINDSKVLEFKCKSIHFKFLNSLLFSWFNQCDPLAVTPDVTINISDRNKNKLNEAAKVSPWKSKFLCFRTMRNYVFHIRKWIIIDSYLTLLHHLIFPFFIPHGKVDEHMWLKLAMCTAFYWQRLFGKYLEDIQNNVA